MYDTRINTKNGADSNVLLVDYFLELIKRNKPNTFIEIGANSAEFSRRIRECYDDIDIYAFEANPYNHKLYSEKYDFKSLNINYINKAVSDVDGKIKFNIQKKINDKEIGPIRGNNSILERTSPNVEYEVIEVDSLNITNFVHSNKIKNDVSLWIDVEGANSIVLIGCKGILDKVNLIFIEVEEHKFWKDQWLETEVNEFLTSFGFHLIARDGEYSKQYNQIYMKNNINL